MRPVHPGEVLREDFLKPLLQTWLNLQTAYDLKVAQKTIAAQIAKDIEPMAAWAGVVERMRGRRRRHLQFRVKPV